jgi:peptidoglycan/xylan/chitin deacetylase (PgdA/CDA1 family)
LSPKDLKERNFHSSKINVLITFDDGYLSWVDVCLPILKKQNIQAVFFVNSGLVDASKESGEQEAYVQENLYLRTKRKIISWEGIKTLEREGHTIGGHTKTHRRLSELQEAEQEIDIQEDKARIEEILQKKISLFAFPFGNRGDYTPVTSEIAFKTGYNHVFSTEPAFLNIATLSTIPRLCIEDGCTKSELVRWIEGGYDLYSKVKKLCAR